MAEEKWTMEKIHKEIYDARTKVFVVAKVLATGTPDVSENPEWLLVLDPLIDDLLKNAGQIKSMLQEKDSGQG